MLNDITDSPRGQFTPEFVVQETMKDNFIAFYLITSITSQYSKIKTITSSGSPNRSNCSSFSLLSFSYVRFPGLQNNLNLGSLLEINLTFSQIYKDTI